MCAVMKDMKDDIYGLIKQLLITPAWKYDDTERRKLEREFAGKMKSTVFAVDGIKGRFNISGM